ncbi:gamma-glutamylcyclotransferase-like [Patiria miniata]|uniref:gamma-glutamylcyclotransferase n=1 Tax=Patiria miniata TaxID=46514 RepID=A0A914BLM7_PATMI|nr:gamma-glutamylcyclotransferase-like [Patiria miniata]
MSLYFTYASNMLRERLLMNNISLAFVTIGKLANYRLRFAEHPKWPAELTWKGAMATIDQSKGDSVWGVVLKINKADLPLLYEQETVNKGFYRRLDPVTITSPGPVPEDLRCFTLQMVDPIFGKKPSPHYLKVILAGARQKCLPDDYQKSLADVEHNGYDGPLPLFDEIMKNVH